MTRDPFARWAIHHDGRPCGICGRWLDPLEQSCHAEEEKAAEAAKRATPIVIHDRDAFYAFLTRKGRV